RPPSYSAPLSLHDALPISRTTPAAHAGRRTTSLLKIHGCPRSHRRAPLADTTASSVELRITCCVRLKSGVRRDILHALFQLRIIDRKSTRLNSSHEWISYA